MTRLLKKGGAPRGREGGRLAGLAEPAEVAADASDGRYVRSVTPQSIALAFATGAAASSPTYSHLSVPVLAIYTVPDTATDMFPCLTPQSDQWDTANAYLPGAQALPATQRAAFASAAPQATVLEVHGVSHFRFLADPDGVESAVRGFLTQ